MDRDVQTRSGPGGFHRRDFLKGSGAAVAASAFAAQTAEQQAAAQEQGSKVSTKEPQKITLTVNGKPQTLTLEPRVTLQDALRNDLNLSGLKDVCDKSVCGACTVLLDGKPMLSCTKLAIECQGMDIKTVETLHSTAATDPVVTSFCQHDGLQCGYCTPGFVMAVRGFCNLNPGASLDDCKKGLGGNLCRCGTYDGVLKAAFETAQSAKGGA